MGNNIKKKQQKQHKQALKQQRLPIPYSKDKIEVNTPIGLVKRVSLNNPVPDGWRILQISEGRQYKKYLNQLLSQWSIVAFRTGKLDGFGYGNGIHETYGAQCGEKFIINMPTLDITAVFFLTSVYNRWEENLLEEVIMQFQK